VSYALLPVEKEEFEERSFDRHNCSQCFIEFHEILLRDWYFLFNYNGIYIM